MQGNEQKVVNRKDLKLVPLKSFLRSFIRKNKLKPHHYAGLFAHAGKRKKATMADWEELFKDY